MKIETRGPPPDPLLEWHAILGGGSPLPRMACHSRERHLPLSHSCWRLCSCLLFYRRCWECASRCLILVGACVLACYPIGGACTVAFVPRAAHVGYARSCFRSVGCGEGVGHNLAETCFEASDFHSRHYNASGFCCDFGSCRLPNASAELVLISICAPFRTQSMRRGPVNALLYVMRLPMAPRS